MNDTISRQAAIEVADAIWTVTGDKNVAKVWQQLKDLPSAERNGHWIYGEHEVAMCDGYRCDQCGYFVPWDYTHKSPYFIEEYHFCPNCGADMRGEQND